MMTPRVRNWALAGSAALTVGVLALHIGWPQPGQVNYWPWALGLMAFPIAAALILAKRPGNGVGRVMGVIALASLANFGSWWYVGNYPNAPLSAWAELVSAIAVLVQFGGIVGLLYVYPTGRPVNRVHRWVALAFMTSAAIWLATWLLSPGPLPLTGQPNPAGLLPEQARAVADNLWDSSFAVFFVLGVVFLALRWRQAAPLERAQLRWFLLAALVVVVTLFLLGDGDPGNGTLDVVAGVGVAIALFWSLPAAIVVAVTRYRLYEIDRLLSRTVSYVLIVGLLVALFATITVGLPQLLGLPTDNPMLVAAATLAVAALFNPLRKRIQGRVDRRFNRMRYKSEQEVERFTSRLRTELDLGELTGEVLDVVTTTMQPATAGVWIREEGTP